MKDAKKQSLQFLAVVFGITWIGLLTAYLSGAASQGVLWNTILVTMQFLPALAILVLHLVGRQVFDPDALGLHPHLKKNVGWYLLAYFLPAVSVALIALLFFLFHPQSFDPAGSAVTQALMENGQSPEGARKFLYSQVILSVFAGPVLSIFPMFAEELGFRGYLLPRIEQLFKRYGKLKSALAVSAAWSLWYVPLYAVGYHYGADSNGINWTGVLIGFVFGFLVGCILAFFTFRTGSVYPAALFRGGVEAMAAVPLYFVQGTTSLLIGPSAYGLFGCAVFLLPAALGLWGLISLDKPGSLLKQR